MGVVFSTSNVLMKWALRFWGDWQVEGRENVPQDGPLIVVSNHLSNLDPPILAASIPRRLYFMAKRGIFHDPVVSSFLKAWGAFPLNRDGADISAIRWSLQTLERGGGLAIFPEGTRSPKGIKNPISGVALIARKSGAPILPVGITGTESVGPPWQIAFPRGEFKVNIGTPFTAGQNYDSETSRNDLEATTNDIMERVASLLPKNYRGIYPLVN
jgi:1-acyl-sn-glycerol-3-phosphate acyltransferase